MKFTILGASGFMGSNLVRYLEQKGIECFCPERNYQYTKKEDLGHVVYCIGMTSDFRFKPVETIEAHVCKLNQVLNNSLFSSFLYLSSTRVYNGCVSGDESSDLSVNPNDFSDLYNISKIMGESVCLSKENEKIRVARLSNVVGDDFNSGNFLFSLIKEAVDTGEINLYQSANIERDYINLNDAVHVIENIVLNGKNRLYNVASGHNVSNADVINQIKRITGCEVYIKSEIERLSFPIINNEKIVNEFSFQSKIILDDIANLIDTYQIN